MQTTEKLWSTAKSFVLCKNAADLALHFCNNLLSIFMPNLAERNIARPVHTQVQIAQYDMHWHFEKDVQGNMNMWNFIKIRCKRRNKNELLSANHICKNQLNCGISAYKISWLMILK